MPDLPKAPMPPRKVKFLGDFNSLINPDKRLPKWEGQCMMPGWRTVATDGHRMLCLPEPGLELSNPEFSSQAYGDKPVYEFVLSGDALAQFYRALVAAKALSESDVPSCRLICEDGGLMVYAEGAGDRKEREIMTWQVLGETDALFAPGKFGWNVDYLMPIASREPIKLEFIEFKSRGTPAAMLRVESLAGTWRYNVMGLLWD